MLHQVTHHDSERTSEEDTVRLERHESIRAQVGLKVDQEPLHCQKVDQEPPPYGSHKTNKVDPEAPHR